MKVIAPLLLALALAFAFQGPAVRLEIGARLPAKIVPKEPKESTFLHARGLVTKPLLRKRVRGIEYFIAYEEEDHQIVQIATYDPHFVTKDGLKVGMFVEVNKEWFHRVAMGSRLGPRTKDGWRTIIGAKAEITILKEGKETILRDGIDIPTDLEAAEMFADKKVIVAKVIGFTKYNWIYRSGPSFSPQHLITINVAVESPCGRHIPEKSRALPVR